MEEYYDDCGGCKSPIMLATAPSSETKGKCVLESNLDERMEPFGDGLAERYILVSDVEDTSHLPAHLKATSFDDLDSRNVFLTFHLSNHTHTSAVGISCIAT